LAAKARSVSLGPRLDCVEFSVDTYVRVASRWP
jgi:hypothetical protein